jgi:hypothetical protein
MDQLIQVAGALAILAAFALAQLELLDLRSYAYLTLNLVGASVLAVLAYHERQWGFLLLETVWAAVSAWALLGATRWSRDPTPRSRAARARRPRGQEGR